MIIKELRTNVTFLYPHFVAYLHSHIKFLMLPPNATFIVQPLDQGTIHSVNRRYKKILAERYLVSVENNKDVNTILKQFDIVAAPNMVHNTWKETS